MDEKSLKHQIILVSLTLAGTVILFLFLYFPGISVTPDSVYYISVARNISIGKGLTGYDGYPLVLQPPLYPLLLLLLKIISQLNFLTIAGIFNAILFGGTIYLSGLLLKKYLHSFVLVITGIFLIITSSIMLKVYLSVLSEPLFILLSLLFLILIEEYFVKKSLGILLLLSLVTAAAIMTRYIGIIILAAGIFRFLIEKEKFSGKKFYRLIIYLLISSLPVLVWIIRNYIISQTLFGSRAASSFTLLQNISLIYNSIAEWFRIPEYFNIYLITIGIFISGLFVVLFLLKRKNLLSPVFRSHLSLTIYILIYLSTLIFTSSMYAYDKIGDRLLSPIYIPLIILLVLAADRILIKQNIIFKIIAAAGILLFMNFSLQKSYFLVDDYINNSGWSYSDKSWKTNSIIPFIEKMNDNNYCLYSNAPDAVYFFTKKEARWSPLKTYYNSEILVNKKQSFYEIKQKEKRYLIWFDNIHRPFLYTLNELNSLVHLKKILKLKEGEIFEITNN